MMREAEKQANKDGKKGGNSRGPSPAGNNKVKGNSRRGRGQQNHPSPMNGAMKPKDQGGFGVPARTTSAPPNLAEQQARGQPRYYNYQRGPNMGYPQLQQQAAFYQMMQHQAQAAGGGVAPHSPSMMPAGMPPGQGIPPNAAFALPQNAVPGAQGQQTGQQQVGVQHEGAATGAAAAAAATGNVGSPVQSPQLQPNMYQYGAGRNVPAYFVQYQYAGSPYGRPVVPPHQQMGGMGGPVPGGAPRTTQQQAPVKREKKILTITNPKTNQLVIPSPTNSHKKQVDTSAKTAAPAPAAAAPAAAAAAPVPAQEKKPAAAPATSDARAEFFSSTKAALEANAGAAAAAAPAGLSSSAVQRKAREDEAQRKMVAAKQRKDKEDEERKRRQQEEEKAKKKALDLEAQAERKRAEMEAKRKAAEFEAKRKKAAEDLQKKQAEEKAKIAAAAASSSAPTKAAEEVAPAGTTGSSTIQDRFGLATESAFGGSSSRRATGLLDSQAPPPSNGGGFLNRAMSEQRDIPVVKLPTDGSKYVYTKELLVRFRGLDHCRTVPPSISPEIIDLIKIEVVPGSNAQQRQNQGGMHQGQHSGFKKQNSFNKYPMGGGNKNQSHQHGRNMQMGGRQNSNPRYQNNNQYNRGGNRGMQGRGGNMGPPLLSGPVEPLKVTANAWVPTKATDEHTATIKKVKGVLNKLTREKFDKLSDDMLMVRMTSVTMLKDVMAAVFDKALGEPNFGDMYADLCKKLADRRSDQMWSFVSVVKMEDGYYWTSSMDESDSKRLLGPYPDENQALAQAQKTTSFKRILLNKCQEEFEKEDVYQEVEKEEEAIKQKLAKKETDALKLQLAELDYTRKKMKRRMLGNIQFIGELFKKKMLTARIMHECIIKLLGDHEKPDEEDIECLCKLLATIGSQLDQKEAKEWIDKYFEHLKYLTQSKQLDARHRFMVKDVIELRNNKWKARFEQAKAKTLKEIEEDRKKEEEAKKKIAQQPLPNQRRNNRGHNNRGMSGRGGPNQGSIMAQVTNSSFMGGGSARTTGSQDARNPMRRPPTRQTGGPDGNFRPSSRPSMRPGGGGGMRPGGGGGMRPGGGMRQTMAPARQSQPPPVVDNTPKIPDAKVVTIVENSLSEYISIKDMSELMANFDDLEKKAPSKIKMKILVVTTAVKWILEKKDNDRNAMMDVLCEVVRTKRVSPSDIVKVLKETVEIYPDLKVDIPLAGTHIANLLKKLFLHNVFELAVLPDILSTLRASDASSAAELYCLVLSTLKKDANGATALKDAKVNVLAFVGETYSGATALKEHGLLDLVAIGDDTEQLISKVKAGEEPAEILSWVEANIGPSKIQQPVFAILVVVAVLEHIESSTGVLSAGRGEPSAELVAAEAEKVTAFAPLLTYCTSKAPASQVQIVHGVALMCDTNRFPSGLIVRLFGLLHSLKIVSTDAFSKWKDLGKSFAPEDMEAMIFRDAVAKATPFLDGLK